MPFWILWMNKRYLKYIKALNPKKDMKIADNKLKTKKLLQDLDIPSPKLIDVIKNRKQLQNYDFSKLEWKEFVVKPNKWSKGKGILICKMINKNIVKISWKLVDIETFKKQIADILDGRYSMTMWSDIAFIEEKIIPWDDFAIFCKYWLADIRLITMKLVPIMAMLRYPTKESNWKANIAAGWIGFGIDIASGKIISMYYNRKIYTKKFPEDYKEFQWKVISYWDDILLYSSQIQYFTNIWYLWLDWTIAQSWPNLIEINAMAGMEIQLVNGEWLENRLKKVEDLKITSPSKWVEVWKTLFSQKQTNPTIQKNMIYLEQPALLRYKEEDDNIEKNIILKVDLENKFNYADPSLISNFENRYKIKFWDTIIDNIKLREKKWLWNTIILWTQQLEDFIIIPKRKDIKDFSIWNKQQYVETEQNILIELDNSLDTLSKKLNISRIVKPLNYMEELDSFITWWWNYNPKFEYKYPTDNKIEQIEEEIKNIENRYFDIKDWYKSWLFDLFKEKLEENIYKLELIKAYKKQDFKLIWKYNELLYWKLDKNILEETKIKLNPFLDKNLWRKLSIYEVLQKVKKHIKDLWLENIKVQLESSLSSRILVKRWDPIIVNISNTSDFYEKEIDMILAHEIDVHVIRYVNWKKTWWKILQSWSGFYLKDEEWLAIWNSFRYLPENYEKTAMYEKYFLISQAEKADFVHLSNIIRWLHPQEWLLKIFRRTMRFKRWIQNTAFKWLWTSYYKDKIYLDGYKKVENFIQEWGDFEKMLKWKYKIDDLKYINFED